jgi:hypothetical protein
MQAEADERNADITMHRITQIVPFGREEDLRRCGPYEKLLRKKQKAHRLQTTPFSNMEEDPEIRAWLEAWELTDKWGENRKRLNAMQLHDSNLCLQKPYAYLHWSQGAGKTVSGTAQGMYRLAHMQTDYVGVVSSAISIETTWAPFLSTYRIPHRVVRKRADLRRVFPATLF